mgnify:FL=1
MLLACMSALTTALHAQDYYDLTSHYLKNSQFDAKVDFGVQATGNQQKLYNDLAEWKKDNSTTASLIVAATFSYGTAATFYNMSIPEAGPDGSADGACLAIASAWNKAVPYTQSVYLPAGHYLLIAVSRNCNPDVQTGTSLLAWLPTSPTEDTPEVLSAMTDFGQGEWMADTLEFELAAPTKGQIRIGFKAGSGMQAKQAAPAFDHVQLLRTTPYSDENDVTGDLPTVKTDKRFARGATMAFGRMSATITDGTITERGFCWSEQPEPTVDDASTTEHLTNNGNIYWLHDLKPATKYYMRAYAKTQGHRVGYGDVIKFYTIPKGNITYWYNNGGDADANNRINTAATQACNIFNNLTSIQKHYSIGYSGGTPTADCYYDDEPWMNMGANASYQRTGTIMHEMQHGLGLVPYNTQWNKNILRASLDGNGRGTGLWLGDRVSAFLDFWDNASGSHLNGDYQHMWPYGINGASEDNGKLELYYANALIGQALGEDGLEHRYNTFADPCYIFNQEDTIKYYLKCEDESCGLYSAFLLPTADGKLQWRDMTALEAQANDSTAWTITFTPTNQYYQLRNVATGQYMTYLSGIRTAVHATPTTNDNFHLMRGRVDVSGMRGYWIIHPTSNWTPPCLQAGANGTTLSSTFNIANASTQQRWLIMTAEEMGIFEQAALAQLRERATDALKDIRALADVPHREDVAGSDNLFAAALQQFDLTVNQATTTTELTGLIDQARQAAMDFLAGVTPTDLGKPFDLSFTVADRGMDATDGWQGTSPALSYSCAEFYQTTFNFNQTISHLPAGTYQMRVQGFQRPGSSTNAYNDYAAGKNNVSAYAYAGATSNLMAHIASDAQQRSIGGAESQVGNGLYMPNNMQAASLYFARGLYENSVTTRLDEPDGQLKIGLRSSSMPDYYWCIFDNVRLYYYGQATVDDVQGVSTVMAVDAQTPVYYDLQGRRVEHPMSGIYVSGGRKVVIS